MKDLCRSAIRAVAPMAAALIVGLPFGSTSARADVRNTYSGAECVSTFPAGANNLSRVAGIVASSPTDVVCPIVKAIFNSTAAVEVGVAASGGTRCQLQSFDVFTLAAPVFSAPQTFPGTGISGLSFSIPRSLRGGMQLRCTLRAGGTILNYLVREQ